MDEKEFESLGPGFRVSEETLLYGITPRLGSHIAERFKQKVVLETCAGAGFLTIELAKVAEQVIAVDIDEQALAQARHNISVADVGSNVTLLRGDVLDPTTLQDIPSIDAAILDPAWNDWVLSHMSPPAQSLFKVVRGITEDVALIVPPTTEQSDLDDFPTYELEKLYLDGELALQCLYFGKLAKSRGSEFRAQ